MADFIPRSVKWTEVQELFEHLSGIDDQLLRSFRMARHNLSDQRKASRSIRLALKTTRDYARFVRVCSHLKYIDGTATEFDDHDAVASTMLYAMAYYSRMRLPTEDDAKKETFIRAVRARWGQGVPGAASNFKEFSSPEWGGTYTEEQVVDFGIITVLEHEYQSVLRRLDRIAGCSGDDAYGFSILNRASPDQDLKQVGQLPGDGRAGSRSEVTYTGREPGSAQGWIGDKSVAVVCTGLAGPDAVDACVERIGVIPRYGWLVVGVCAGTDEKWPLGTVLVSSRFIADVYVDAAGGTAAFERRIEPLPLEMSDHAHRMSVCFRRVHHVDGLHVAPPDGVPVRRVPFACANVVVRQKAIRDAVKAELAKHQLLVPEEEIGIEMEAAGIPCYQNREIAIIKGVCDYADERKQTWPPDLKVRLQLYAAETAADFVVRIIETWPLQTDSNTASA